VEIAKLVLEFLKVLTWPAVALIVVLLFRPHLERILRQFSDRLGTAETLKLGIMGQEVQISGTAKELAKERAMLVQTPIADNTSGRLQVVEEATRELNNPLADVVGLKLLQSTEPIQLENLVHAIVSAFGIGGIVGRLYKQPPMVILSITREVEKVLAILQKLGFLKAEDGAFELSPAGRRFFQRVADHQSEFLARYHAVK